MQCSGAKMTKQQGAGPPAGTPDLQIKIKFFPFSADIFGESA
jgi:hypothetical protein